MEKKKHKKKERKVKDAISGKKQHLSKAEAAFLLACRELKAKFQFRS